MKGKEWLIVIAAVIVVAVLASLITSNLTGNVVKVPTSVATTQTDIYTKTEVDGLIKNIGGTPKNCMVHSFASSAYSNGNILCAQQTANKCLIGELILTATTNKTTSSGYPELATVYPRFFKCSDTFTGVYNKTIPGLMMNKEYQVICCD
jgi:hypothetical protein